MAKISVGDRFKNARTGVVFQIVKTNPHLISYQQITGGIVYVSPLRMFEADVKGGRLEPVGPVT